MVVIDRGVQSRNALRNLGVLVDWHEYTMEHSVCPAEISEITRWLAVRAG